MTEKIKVLIVDDLPTTRESVAKLLKFESGVELVGEASTGLEAIEMVAEKKPDIVLMDINMPDMDGITASQKIAKSTPETQIIMMSVQSEAGYMRRAMLAGARDFLTKPFSLDELLTAINNAYERKLTLPVKPAPEPAAAPTGDAAASAQPRTGGKVLAVYSPKGGSGCTTVAVNVAVSLAQSGRKTVLVDGSLQFGDAALMLNLKTPTTIIDLVERIDDLDRDLISSVVMRHRSGLDLLAAPLQPEMAELVTVEHIKKLLDQLCRLYEHVIVDTSAHLSDINLSILDSADQIYLITSPNLASLKNTSRFFDLSNALGYEMTKVSLLVNGSSDKRSISVQDVSTALKRPVAVNIPRDNVAAEAAADQGEPLVDGPARKRPVAAALKQAAMRLVEKDKETAPPEKKKDKPARPEKKPSFLSRLFGRKS